MGDITKFSLVNDLKWLEEKWWGLEEINLLIDKILT